MFVDIAGPHIQSTPEYARKAEDIVHLIGIVGAAGGHHNRSRLQCQLGHDLRLGIGHGKYHGIPGHAAHHVWGHYSCHREAQKDVRPTNGIGQSAGDIAWIGKSCDLLL